MASIVIMPRQGISVESCVITRWCVAEGAAFQANEPLFSYETGKAAFEENAAQAGVLLKILRPEGDDVPCLEPVCIIGQAGEDISELMAQVGGAGGEPEAEVASPAAARQPAAVGAAQPVAQPQATGNADVLKTSPRARNAAARLRVELSDCTPTGPNGRIIERDVQTLYDAGQAATRASHGQAAGIVGTGIGGRVTLADVAAQAAQAPVAATASEVVEVAVPAPQTAGYTDRPQPPIRKVIARNMAQSLATIPQLTHHASFDATALLAYRAQVKAHAEKLGVADITLGDMVVYGVTRVLRGYPELNAHLMGDTLRLFDGVNLGLAVDTPRGLMVPTLFGADKMSLSDISKATKDLAEAARSGSIAPDLLTGASFTVSNLGSVGVEMFTPVINPPQTGILGVCNITYRPKPDGNGGFTFYPAMGLSLTYDHRALDGAPATRFLRDLGKALEHFPVLLGK